ncbi:hypothetical protein VCUG_02354 [Vavraia culicis subsp. floridensis]|uniref:Uncharacterized protein n=1 Tax=Vavraia culicis (isolate floridensis) TaxID=948595 RepID=L2GRY9_VAVCU|nr:uncharacterized protein VCUG_02354 [Vavraia culicis subsp. floridensis]ELA46152.1 hypothetical protein VCUG_02354 [Vavraia culicis subsp. floridensis]
MKKFDAVAHYTAKLPKALSKSPVLHLTSKKPVSTKLTALKRRSINNHSIQALQNSFVRAMEHTANVTSALRVVDLTGARLRAGVLSGTVVGESRSALLMVCGGVCKIIGKKGRVFRFEWKGTNYFLVGDLMDSNRIAKK